MRPPAIFPAFTVDKELFREQKKWENCIKNACTRPWRKRRSRRGTKKWGVVVVVVVTVVVMVVVGELWKLYEGLDAELAEEEEDGEDEEEAGGGVGGGGGGREKAETA